MLLKTRPSPSCRAKGRTLIRAQTLDIHSLGFFRSRCVQFGTAHARVVSTRATKSASEGAISGARTLHGERFSHDRTAASENLEVRHAAGAGRDMVGSGGGGERAERGGGRLRQERAHGPRLAQ